MAIKSTSTTTRSAVSFSFCGSRSSRPHSYFMCWEVEMLQMNYTDSRWPESKHLASFAWGFPWAALQICTYPKRTKEGVFSSVERRFKGADSCKWCPEPSCDVRPCNKDKVLWEEWCFEVIQGGFDIPLRDMDYCAWSGCYFKWVFLKFILLFIYLIITCPPCLFFDP